ncbi:MAG: hypothetical protein Q7J24_02625 [Desulfomicrobium sp.]|nr:hypothetical protein [Desulfomicrobium sp.]
MIDTNSFCSHRSIALCALPLVLMCFLFLAPMQVSAASATVYVEGVPGGVIVHTEEVAAKVMEIDHAKRTVTLQSPDGETFAAKVGEGAVNFDQVAVGDMVNVTLTEELVVFLDEEGAAPIDSSSAALATAPKGAQPGGLVVASNQVTDTVTAIDHEQRTATLQFKDGSTKTLPVRDDIDLTLRKVGDQVVFRLTEKLAISVEKP